MRILHVSTYDMGGGAARAAYRLHKGLQNIGVNSTMLVQKKLSDDFSVQGPATKLGKAWAALRPNLDALPTTYYKEKSLSLFSPAWLPFSGVANEINASDADVVHLHWINQGFVRLEEIAQIKKPIVWTLHDNWAFTGGCHVMWDCEKYKSHCGACPRLGSTNKRDLSFHVFDRKLKHFKKADIRCVVGVSHWLSDCARESKLFEGCRVETIPNPIDLTMYKPVDQLVARELLNLPKDKKYILFGAMDDRSDPNKGFDKLAAAVRMLDDSAIELLVLGGSTPSNFPDLGMPIHFLGKAHDDLTLRITYSASDVMVVPSLQEAFGQVASEAMSCGTPVVAFAKTGLLDIVDHKVNGYLATPFSSDDLALGIKWALNQQDRTALGICATKKVRDDFESTKVANRMFSLYEDILRN